MVFASYEFIYIFLPIVLVLYFKLSKTGSIKLQHGFLVLASLFFYGYFHPPYLLIMIGSIAVNYGIAQIIQRFQHSKGFRDLTFAVGVLFNIGLLGYFKYYDFFISNVNSLSGSNMSFKHLMLPLGISFFTFQQFSFQMSIYKGREKVEGFVDYCLFVTFCCSLSCVTIYDFVSWNVSK